MSEPAWALGFDVELLKSFKKMFKEEFKPHTYGAFGIPNERDLATALSKSELVKHGNSIAVFKKLKVNSRHEDFCGRTQSVMAAGSLFIKAIAGPDKKAMLEQFLKTPSNGVWVEAHVENKETVQILRDLGFQKCLTKVSASSDLKGLFFFCPNGVVNGLPAEEVVGLKELAAEFITPEERSRIISELELYAETLPWAQHYSSYNKRQSWTAFALKGYALGDPGFIIKPAEMSKAWKAENPERLQALCSWTTAAEHFKYTTDLLRVKIPCLFQRVRLMKLSSKGGELTRHADITDPEAGVRDGQIARLHIPLVTAPECQFKSWGLDGDPVQMHLKPRSLNYLDTRKPHAVKNDSASERIHLVIDAVSNDWLRELIRG